MIRKAILILLCAFTGLISRGETKYSVPGTAEDTPNLWEKMQSHGIMNKLELAANIGTTGLGLEVATPVTKWAKVRAGFDVMPRFGIPMKFGMESYSNGVISNKFDRIRQLMYDISGYEIDQYVKMDSKFTLATFRFLVDVYPFRNRHWHVTAGFFAGGNSMGKSINIMTEMPSLLALNMYDRLHKSVTADDFIENIIDKPIYGDFYLDPEVAMKLQEKMQELGTLGIHIGDYKDGTPYMMMPDKDGTVWAKARVNRFRPYVGFGYGGAMSADGKWEASFDAGVQFWGGAPKVTTHDGTVLNDLVNLKGKLKSYMGFMKALPVYPTVDFRISYRF